MQKIKSLVNDMYKIHRLYEEGNIKSIGASDYTKHNLFIKCDKILLQHI